VEFGVLGPLAVTSDGEPLTLRSTKQRILLAMLLSHANTPVSQRRLMEALWDTPPASAAENLRLYVHQLRRALGNGERITREPSGYAVTVHSGELDAQTFSDAAANGSRVLAAGDAEQASRMLTEALSLWRGPAYGDLAEAPVIRQAALRLEETPAAGHRGPDRRGSSAWPARRADRRVDQPGRGAPVPGDAAGAPDACALRRGRQAEALEVYRQTRRCSSMRSASSRGRSCGRCTPRSCVVTSCR
jgi:DNA-binding winged helix-turn-helix (wHTH) protein